MTIAETFKLTQTAAKTAGVKTITVTWTGKGWALADHPAQATKEAAVMVELARLGVESRYLCQAGDFQFAA